MADKGSHQDEAAINSRGTSAVTCCTGTETDSGVPAPGSRFMGALDHAHRHADPTDQFVSDVIGEWSQATPAEGALETTFE